MANKNGVVKRKASGLNRAQLKRSHRHAKLTHQIETHRDVTGEVAA